MIFLIIKILTTISVEYFVTMNKINNINYYFCLLLNSMNSNKTSFCLRCH